MNRILGQSNPKLFLFIITNTTTIIQFVYR